MSDTIPAPTQFAPEAYRADNPAAIVRAYPFATLTTATEQGIYATQTPIFFEHDQDETTLIGHLARRNPHAAALTDGQHALILFTGPHAYVSGRWYKEKPQVPTWAYVSAQARGTLEVIDDEADKLTVLRRSTEMMEPQDGTGWTLESAPAGRIETLLPMIRAFRIRLDKLEGVTKLTQTHPRPYQLRVAAEMEKCLETRPMARMIKDLPDTV
ncbi:FMN-binding negative transcriptional regulator [Altericroceibacterium spongiae]|uniref:FMN-binding negative transcriptional regulator n=1 Tax=Altericroceibacterium spongiae TaxID=2320269 RepID=A0A420EFA2_9SPHN|nr:FMN-binding negative transcriptional regulator [Altericroceibacterium spongiae]RKF19381.1 FMN-binding negative transcriptional regulator [Altericroceibacterium spongiae]